MSWEKAASVKETLLLLDSCHPDVVVTDLSLRDSNAIERVRALPLSGHGARVLIMTAFQDSSYAADLLSAGAAGYVLKQQPTADLLAAIDAVASGKRYIPAAVAALLEPMGRSPRLVIVSGRFRLARARCSFVSSGEAIVRKSPERWASLSRPLKPTGPTSVTGWVCEQRVH